MVREKTGCQVACVIKKLVDRNFSQRSTRRWIEAATKLPAAFGACHLPRITLRRRNRSEGGSSPTEQGTLLTACSCVTIMGPCGPMARPPLLDAHPGGKCSRQRSGGHHAAHIGAYSREGWPQDCFLSIRQAHDKRLLAMRRPRAKVLPISWVWWIAADETAHAADSRAKGGRSRPRRPKVPIIVPINKSDNARRPARAHQANIFARPQPLLSEFGRAKRHGAPFSAKDEDRSDLACSK